MFGPNRLFLFIGFLAVMNLASVAGANAQPSATILPALVSGQSMSLDLAVNEIAWFQFDASAERAENTFLDITTSFGDLNDTSIALYDSSGELVASDDDDGIELRSTLSFGVGSGLSLGDPFNLGDGGGQESDGGRALGDDGDLPQGTYYLAIGAYESRFGASAFDAHSFSDLSGASQVTFYTTAVPEPCGIWCCLLGLGVCARRMIAGS